MGLKKFFKSVGQTWGDSMRMAADNVLTVAGMPEVIKDSDYKRSTGLFKQFNDLVEDKTPAIQAILATSVGGGVMGVKNPFSSIISMFGKLGATMKILLIAVLGFFVFKLFSGRSGRFGRSSRSGRSGRSGRAGRSGRSGRSGRVGSYRKSKMKRRKK